MTANMTLKTAEIVAPLTKEAALPVLGAAMHAEDLNAHLAWLTDSARDLEIQDAITPELLDGDWQVRARRINDILQPYPGRIGIHGPFLSLTLMAQDPQIRTVVQTRLMKALDFAEAIGATHMVAHSPFDFFGHPMVVHSPAHGLADQIEHVAKTLEPVLPKLEQIDCTLVIETIRDRHPRPLLTLLDTIDAPCVRMSIDLGHVYIGHRLGGPTPDQWVHEAGPRLAHVHLQDTDGDLDRHWPPGMGVVNWEAFFGALRTLPTQPRLIIELVDVTQLPRAAGWLTERGLAR